MADKLPDIQTIFNEALERNAGEERTRYLDEACRGVPRIRERVEALLAAYSGGEGFLGGSMPGNAPTIAPTPPVEQPGTYIGPYKLHDEIGEGGMGSVYMAVQKEPIRRKVALKVIKPGMDSKQVISRFEAERQALAMMDHPNIARVIDGGTTESGRPYFVMELVKGIPITDYCDRYRLTTNERLEVFGDICSAVQHAHQKGIIHRDLKPSNILVTQLDGNAIPKVIDFGIAKATADRITEDSWVTAHAQMVGTPMYMSPEQTDVSAADVDTRSDVYSLGVLLYELLTGTTPFDRERMSSVSFDEFRHIIQEEDPPRPSTRLSTLDAALETVADNRHTDPRTLSHEVRGELDWIVMKALEKDRTRRYESASDFASDVRRYLNDEAVVACPPSKLYRFRKFARRNKTVLLTSTLVIMILLGATVVSVWQAVRANKSKDVADHQRKLADDRFIEEQRARTEAQEANLRAEDRTDLALQVVTAMYEDINWLADTPRSEEVREAYVERALQLFEGLEQEKGVNAETQYHLGRLTGQLAVLYRGWGKLEEAMEYANESVKLLEANIDGIRPELDTRFQLARGYGRLAYIEHQRRNLAAATNWLHREVAIYEDLLKTSPGNQEVRRALADAHEVEGDIAAAEGNREKSMQIREDICRMRERLVSDEPENAELHRALAAANHNLAREFEIRGDGVSSADAYQSAIDAQTKALELDPYSKGSRVFLGRHYSQLSHVTYQLLGNTTEAVRLGREAVEIFGDLVDEYPRDTVQRRSLASAYNVLANAFMRAGDLESAREAYEHSLDVLTRLVSEFPNDGTAKLSLALSRVNLGRWLREHTHLEDALRTFTQAIEVLRILTAEEQPQESYYLAVALSGLAATLENMDRMDESLEAYSESRDILRTLVEQYDKNATYRSELGGVLHNIAISHVVRGQCDQAIITLEEAIQHQEAAHRLQPSNQSIRRYLHHHYVLLSEQCANVPSPDVRNPLRAIALARKAIELDPKSAVAWQSLGIAQYRYGEWREAVESLARSNDLASGGDGWQWFFLAMCHHELEDSQQARTWYERAIRWMVKKRPDDTRLRCIANEASKKLGIPLEPNEKKTETGTQP